MREVAIVGIGIHQFGRFAEKDYVQLAQQPVFDALKDAGMDWKDIQTAFAGTVFCGSSAGLRVLAEVGYTGIPIVDVENACASGGSAFRLAYQAVAYGIYDTALALGFDKTPRGFIISPRYQEWERRMGFAANPIFFALNARKHMQKYGMTAEQMARVSVKNHKNGALNPNAMYQKKMSFEEIMNSQMVCDPFRLLMLCAPNDGAVAVILCSKEKALKYTRNPITIAAAVLKSPLYNTERFEGVCESTKIENQQPTVAAAREVYDAAGLGPKDLDFIELQDHEAAAEIIFSEQLGLCEPGEGGRLIDEGISEIGGRLPINVSGGLLSKGEPLGASALGQIHELVMQLRGTAGPRQVANAKVGMAHVVGAGGNCSISILKR